MEKIEGDWQKRCQSKELAKSDNKWADSSLMFSNLFFKSRGVFFSLSFNNIKLYTALSLLSRTKKWWTLKSWMTTLLPFKVMMLDFVAWVPPEKKLER